MDGMVSISGATFLMGSDRHYNCRRYRPSARMAQPVDTSTSHLGFRCVVRQ